MGYTITIHPKTPALAEKMLAFAKNHFRNFQGVTTGKAGPQYFGGPYHSKDLSYCHRKGHIGFDYNSAVGEQRAYVYMLLHWMAVKVGRRTKAGDPRYLYDGEDWFVIAPDKHDELGRPKKTDIFAIRGGTKRDDKRIRAEISRLNALWEKERKG